MVVTLRNILDCIYIIYHAQQKLFSGRLKLKRMLFPNSKEMEDKLIEQTGEPETYAPGVTFSVVDLTRPLL